MCYVCSSDCFPPSDFQTRRMSVGCQGCDGSLLTHSSQVGYTDGLSGAQDKGRGYYQLTDSHAKELAACSAHSSGRLSDILRSPMLPLSEEGRVDVNTYEN